MKYGLISSLCLLGLFVFQMQVVGQRSIANEQPAVPLIGLEFAGYVDPLQSSDIKASCWGIQMGSLRPDIIRKATEIGVKWTRLTASWPDIEHEKGIYDFTRTDSAFEAALSNGIEPFVNLGKGNPIYTGYARYSDPKLASIYGQYSPPPVGSRKAMTAYLAYIRATVERYKDIIDYWEIWNEPNHQNYWGAPPDGKEYGKLLRETALLIRSIDPGCKIIAGATASIDPEFTDDFLSQGNSGLVDVISFHNYGPVPEERIYACYDLRAVIDTYNPEIEIWQGECGYPSASSTRDYRGRAPWGELVQAKWLLRQGFTDTYYCRAKVSNYFLLANFGNRDSIKPRMNLTPLDSILGFPERNGSRVRTWGVNEKCLLQNPGLEPKTGFYAYQNLCAIWNGNYEPHPVKYSFDIVDEGVFSGISHDDAFPSVPLLAVYENDRQQALVAWWLPWYMSEYLPELATVNLAVKTVRFVDPVLIDLLDGKIYEIEQFTDVNGETRFESLPMADYPLVICERDSFRMK